MRIVAVDLEGTGGQDDDEAILEIALVPLTAELEPDMSQAFSTLLNPGRPIPRKPWISPGITDAAVANVPFLSQVAGDIRRLVDGAHLLGHNVRVDWGLLAKKLPDLKPAGLLDTLRLARAHHGKTGNGLASLIDHHDLAAAIANRVPEGRPHRALWDTVACALLFAHLSTIMHLDRAELTAAAAISAPDLRTDHPESGPPSLFDSL